MIASEPPKSVRFNPSLTVRLRTGRRDNNGVASASIDTNGTGLAPSCPEQVTASDVGAYSAAPPEVSSKGRASTIVARRGHT